VSIFVHQYPHRSTSATKSHYFRNRTAYDQAVERYRDEGSDNFSDSALPATGRELGISKWSTEENDDLVRMLALHGGSKRVVFDEFSANVSASSVPCSVFLSLSPLLNSF